MISSRMRSRGRITIPKEIREKLGLAPGAMVRFQFQAGEIRLQADDDKNPPLPKTKEGRNP